MKEIHQCSEASVNCLDTAGHNYSKVMVNKVHSLQ